MKKETISLLKQGVNLALSVSRELRASRAEVRAEKREARAEENHVQRKKYFGREI